MPDLGNTLMGENPLKSLIPIFSARLIIMLRAWCLAKFAKGLIASTPSIRRTVNPGVVLIWVAVMESLKNVKLI